MNDPSARRGVHRLWRDRRMIVTLAGSAVWSFLTFEYTEMRAAVFFLMLHFTCEYIEVRREGNTDETGAAERRERRAYDGCS